MYAGVYLYAKVCGNVYRYVVMYAGVYLYVFWCLVTFMVPFAIHITLPFVPLLLLKN